ncbi:hypothetical protein NM208_g5558 [Fusarium decemcellulare]|uniref:Uncharacterized protein n=1 Tax=Fusarium decemcellulare TaxID=57161 RepID=A0ACC1SGJ6_9HYPO|nr:hypothetical protein NM208_g5558 [Fusarium decemcellulare]
MRFFALVNFLAAATALPTALAPKDPGNAVNVAARDDAVSLEIRDPVPQPESEADHTIEAREVKSFPWPEDSFAVGNIAWQVRVTNLRSNKYKIEFFNSSPLNGWTFRYTVSAVGSGGAGVIAEKVLAPQVPGGSVEVAKTGDTVQVEVVQA